MAQAPADGLVVDVDAHYFEDPRSFCQYLDEPWRRRIARWTAKYMTPAGGRSSVTADTGVGGRINHRMAAPLDSPEHLQAAMRYLGVDVAVLLPSSILTLPEITDRSQAVALARGYIDYMLDQVVDPACGVYTLVMAPTQEPAAAARLIDRVAAHDGVCGVCLGSAGPVLPLGDPYYDPIYDACSRHDLPAVVHSGYGGPQGGESGFGLQTLAENRLAFVLNNQIQLTSIVMQGVPERFPGLRLVFEEAGLLWIPMMMYRLDLQYAQLRSQHPWLKRPPSEYIHRFHFDTQPFETTAPPTLLKAVFDAVGARDSLMYASDWPHSDFDSPNVIRDLRFLDAETRARILGGSAVEVFRFRGLGAGVGRSAVQAEADGRPSS